MNFLFMEKIMERVVWGQREVSSILDVLNLRQLRDHLNENTMGVVVYLSTGFKGKIRLLRGQGTWNKELVPNRERSMPRLYIAILLI